MASQPFIEIRTDLAAKELEKRLKALYSPEAHKAINRAINRSLGKANTELNREIRSAYNIALKDLNDKDNKLIKQSTESSLTGTINASQMPLSLSKFNPSFVSDRIIGGKYSSLVKTQKGRSTKVRRGNLGVTVEIIKGQKVQLPSAFMLFQGGAAGSPVFARGTYNTDGFKWGKPRLPISKLNTKSVFYAIFSADIEEHINNIVAWYYPERLVHELNQGLKYQPY